MFGNNLTNFYITGEKIEGKIATVLGWGFTSFKKGHLSQFLRETELTVMKRKDCMESKVGKSMGEGLICASGKTKDACQVIILFNML